MNAALLSELDAALTGRAIVVGSLPPEGRDLDLLVRPEEEAALARALAAAGFAQAGTQWARFAAGTADVVELIPTSDWRLSPAAVSQLFSAAIALDGCERIARPAPADALLALARRMVVVGHLDDKRRARADAALREDAGAWGAAAQRAPGWHLRRGLSLLQHAHATGEALPQRERLRAARDLRVLGRIGRFARMRRPLPGIVVAFSGLDGCGKSSQTQLLAATLDQLGIPSQITWNSLIASATLGRIAHPFKQLLKPLAKKAVPEADPEKEDPTWSPSAPTMRPDEGSYLRRRSGVLTFGWTTIAVAVQAYKQARSIWPAVRAGHVVICDRYFLDTKVHLRYEYGGHRQFRAQMAILRAVSPRPRRAWLLEVPAATAHARKGEYEVHQLERRATLYREEAPGLGVTILDGEREMHDLAAEIAVAVWRAYAERA